MDRGDIEGTVELFQADGQLLCDGLGIRPKGHDELRAFFRRMMANSRGMVHRAADFVVDTTNRRVATTLVNINRRPGGERLEMLNCNLFEIGRDGRFIRVRFWLGQAVPDSVHRRKPAKTTRRPRR